MTINFDQKNSYSRRILIFDIAQHAHLPGYIQNLVEYWVKNKLQTTLNVVLLPSFFRSNFTVSKLVSQFQSDNVKFFTISEAEIKERNRLESTFYSTPNRIGNLLKSDPNYHNLRSYEWSLFNKYIDLTQATESFIVYLDDYLPLLASGAKCPIPVSGIYFYPTFHFPTVFNHQPSPKQKSQYLQEKFILARASRHPMLKNLFTLDPFAVKPIAKIMENVSVSHLCEPIQFDTQAFDGNASIRAQNLRKELNIEPNRRVFLSFGHFTSRKGVNQLLSAIQYLDSLICENLCLLLVGPINLTYQWEIESEIAKITDSKPIQIVTDFRFIDQPNVAPYFNLADAIAITYINHAGMSSVLLLAAAAKKPVLCSDYALLGQMVKHYKLGITVDSHQPKEIAQGLSQFWRTNSSQLSFDAKPFYDVEKMENLTQQHSGYNFAAQVFNPHFTHHFSHQSSVISYQ